MNAFITLDYETSLAKLALNGRPQPQETQATPSWVNALKAIPMYIILKLQRINLKILKGAREEYTLPMQNKR